MGIISIIGLSLTVIKIIFQVIALIKQIRLSDPNFDSKSFLERLHEAISILRTTGSAIQLDSIHQELKSKCEGSTCR